MVITLTSIKLKSLWKFFSLSWHGFKISQQTKQQPGFLQLKNTGFGYDHYTATAWEDGESMKHFARSGAHLEAMKATKSLAKEIRTYTFEGDQIPDWKESRKLLQEKGKILSY